MVYLILLAGFLILFSGSQSLLKGVTFIAQKYNVSQTLLAIVIVGFGTSLPELAISLSATVTGNHNIILGNVVGSNIVNILFIFAWAMIIFPFKAKRQEIQNDVAVFFFSSLFLSLIVIFDFITIFTGLLMLITLIGYIILSYYADQNKANLLNEQLKGEIEVVGNLVLHKAIFFCIFGLALLASGSVMLVDSAVEIARRFSVPESIIGMSVLAFGSSLPELSTIALAAAKKRFEIILGSIIGSNIFNILGILGFNSIIATIPIDAQIADFSIWFMLGICSLFSLALLFELRFNKVIGSIMICLYIVYTYLTYQY